MHVSKFVLANVSTSFCVQFQLLGTRVWMVSKLFETILANSQASGMRGLNLSRPDGERKDLKGFNRRFIIS